MADWRYDSREGGWTWFTAEECRQRKLVRETAERNIRKDENDDLWQETEIKCHVCGETKTVHSRNLVKRQLCADCWCDEANCKAWMRDRADWDWDELLEGCQTRFPNIPRRHIISYITDIEKEKMLGLADQCVNDIEEMIK